MTGPQNKVLGTVLEQVLRERSNEFQLDEAELARIGNEEPDALERVTEFLNASASFREAVIVRMSELTCALVEKELKRLSEIKRSREFTAEEIAYGCDVLPALLDSLEKLVKGKPS